MLVETFTIRGVLGTSFEVWKRNFVPFTLLAALCYAPVLVLQLLFPEADWELYSLAINLLINALIASAVTFGVIMELHGSRPSNAQAFVRGFASIGPTLRVSLVSGLAIFGGVILLVVPGVIVMLMLFVVVPVAVTERLGAMAALRRSRKLTHGYKGRLFWVVAVMFVLSGGLQLALEDVVDADAQALVYFVLDVAWGVFAAVVAAVAYTRLRAVQEGAQVPQLARAFARLRDTRS